MSIECLLIIPEQKKLKDQQILVGRPLHLNCKGAFDSAFDFSKAEFKVGESQKHFLRLVSAKGRTADEFDVHFVTYKVGETDWSGLVLTDGTLELSLNPPVLKVESVIEKTEDGKSPEAFGMIYPLSVEWPWIYTAILIVAISALIWQIFVRIRLAARYAKLVADLSAYRSSVDPEMQFYRSLRLAEKNSHPLPELEKAFRLYILRKMDIPMLTLPDKEIRTFVKKKYRTDKIFRDRLNKTLDEIKVVKEKDRLAPDADARRDFSRKLMKFVEQLEAKK